GKTVLILDVNPFMTGADFHPEGVYRINVDNDGDLQADAAFSFVFSESNDGTQTGSVRYARGNEAPEREPAGEVLIEGTPVGFDAMARPVEAGPCRLFIGVRSDPFFADGEGAFHDFQFTGDDTFAGKNILSHVAGGAQRHARPWSRDRRLGNGECAERWEARAG